MQVFREAPSDVGVVYTAMLRVVDDEERYIPYPGVEQTDGGIRRSLADQNSIPTQVAMVRRKCFDEVGDSDVDAWPISDWEIWIRISQRFRLEFVDEVLVIGEVRPDSISTNTEAEVRARERIIEKHRSFFNAVALANHLFYVGHGFMKLEETRKGQTYLS